MPTIQKKSLGSPDETMKFEKGKAEMVKLGGATVGRLTFEPGWKWSTCVKPIAKTQSCQVHHFVYQVSGRMKVVMDDGAQTELGPGEVADIPPGHDAWVVGNEPVVVLDFQGATKYAK